MPNDHVFAVCECDHAELYRLDKRKLEISSGNVREKFRKGSLKGLLTGVGKVQGEVWSNIWVRLGSGVGLGFSQLGAGVWANLKRFWHTWGKPW